MPTNKITSVNYNPTLTHKHHDKNNFGKKDSVKAGVTAATVLGVGTTYALIARKQGFSLNPNKICHTPVKDWAIFKIFNRKQPDRKLIELEEKEILALASGSVAGGLAGGAIFDDKKNLKAKGREALNQILGNVLVPVMFVGGVSRLYKKFQKPILNRVPQIKDSVSHQKLVKNLNKALKCVPSILMTIAGLGAGIIVGNKVSNFINEKLYHKKIDRKIKSTDFAPHVDDVSMAVTLMADKAPLSSAITNTVPLFLCVPGYQTAIAKE